MFLLENWILTLLQLGFKWINLYVFIFLKFILDG